MTKWIVGLFIICDMNKNNHLTQTPLIGQFEVHNCTDRGKWLSPKTIVGIVILLLLQTFMANVFAGERTKEEMRMAALNALSNSNKARGKMVTAKTSDLREYVAMEKLSVIGSEDLGFAVVTSDDRFDEVIGYSTTKFSDDMPCGFKWWMETAEKVMENTKGKPATSRSKIRSKAAKSSVEPLMTTKWGQNNPFNALLKYKIGNTNYTFLTGCVATAMAQVMKYHRYPEKSTGSIEYVVENYWAKMSHEFDATYDYDNMLDEYNYQIYGSLDVKAKAVATLMQDCGMAVKMNYGTKGSGAYSKDIPIGLKTYFAYSEETERYQRKDYTRTEWMQMIYNEFSAGRPIIYTGVDKTDPDPQNHSGHAFVLHGYNSSGLVYVNWGWKGYLDGYFDIDLLNPDPDTYSSDQDMVFAIPGNSQTIVYSYNLSIITDGNGSVSYNDNTIRNNVKKYSIDEGGSATLTITPDYGYQIKSVTVNDIDVTSQVYNNQYTINNITQNTTVNVVFEALPVATYNFTISASGNGSVSYNSNSVRDDISTFTIEEGKSATLSITPDNGYAIKSVTINNYDVTSQVYNNSYTISSIAKNTIVNVVFEIRHYSFTISASGNGSVLFDENSIKDNSSTFTLDNGSTAILSFTPDVGYMVKSLVVNNIDVTSQVNNNRYMISDITQNTTVNVVFDALPVVTYDFTISASGNGSVSFNGNSIKNYTSIFNLVEGSSATFTIVPDNGYRIKNLTVNDNDVTSKVVNSSYTISNITKNTSVNVVFEAIQMTSCNLIISASGNGSVLYNGNSVRENTSLFSIYEGSSATITFTPDNGYKVMSITVNDIDVTSQVSDNRYTLSNVTSNTTISILFRSISFNPSDYNSSVNFEVDGIKYYSPSGTDEARVTSKTGGYSGSITIPSTVTYNGLPYRVTSIGEYSFANCTGLQELSMQESIVNIGKAAFYKCSNLTNIELPNSVTTIGDNAFSDCSSLTNITLPNSVTIIDNYAFRDCSSLTSIVLPNSVTTIGNYAFSGCSSLTNIALPNGVTNIGDNAFYGCSSFSKIALPNSVTSIGKLAFYGCNFTSVILPDGITTIANGLFQSCSNLKNITIPVGITSIGEFAFYGCNLQTLVIPANVKTIGSYAFNDMSNLTDVFCLAQNPPILDSYFPRTVSAVYVNKQALESYKSANYWNDNKIIGLSIEGIEDFINNGYNEGVNNYLSCGITSITKTPPSQSYFSKSFALYISNQHSDAITITRVIARDPETGDALRVIEDKDFLVELNGGYSKDFGISIDKDVDPIFEIYYTYKGNFCRLNTKAEVNGQFDLTIQAIGNGSVSCNGMRAGNSQILTLKVDEVSSYKLDIYPNSGYRIKSVTINGLDVTSQVSEDRYYTINSISSNTDVVVEFENNPYSPNANVQFEIDGIRYEAWGDKDEVSVIRKEEGYFGVINIPEVVTYNGLPYRVTRIAYNAFIDCIGLQKVNMSDNIVEIGIFAFQNCSNLESIKLSEHLTKIGGSAFSGCSSLTSINIPNSVTTIVGDAFSGCSSLSSISIPSNVTSIGDGTFSSCSNLTNVILPSGISKIPNSLFRGCSNLQNVTIPAEVTSIGEYAFSRCNLHSLVIPANVKTIGNNAFGNNNYLSDICCLSTTPPVLGNTTSISEGATVYVYQQALDSYKSAKYWQDHKIVGLSKEDMEEFCLNGYSDGINDFLSCGITSIASSGYIIGSNSYIQKALGMFVTNNHSDAIFITKVVAKNPSTGSQLAIINDEDILGYVNGGETKVFTITIHEDVDPVYEIYYTYENKPCLFNTNATDIRRFDITIESKGEGTVNCNDQTVQNSTIKLKQDLGSRCTLAIIPDHGYRIKSVLLNGTDVTSQVLDYIFVISRISSDNTVSVEFEENIIPGDVNGDFTVDVVDVVSIINYIMGKPSGVFNETLADLNEDGEIDIFDVTLAINIALNNNNVIGDMLMATRSSVEQAIIGASGDGVTLGVNNPDRFTAFQFDVEVAEGIELTNARLTVNSGNHKVLFMKNGQNTYRVIGISMDNSVLTANGTDLVELRFSKGGDVQISNITFATPQEDKVHFAGSNAIVTGIGDITIDQQEEIFDLSGRKIDTDRSQLPKGIYIINNKKVVIK